MLSERALRGLQSYKYVAAGHTALDKLHDSTWNWIVHNVFPTWLAPNLITLAGVLCLVFAYALNWALNPDYLQQLPTWVYVINAAAVFAYVNLDSMDGKQARRTGSSSPLGQLFDHGCDALAVHLTLSCLASSMQLHPGWWHVVGSYVILGAFYLGHWEEYHSGVMMYGNDVVGVLEANYAIVVIHVATVLAGPGLWVRTFTVYPEAVGFLAGDAPLTATYAEIAVVAVCAASTGLWAPQLSRGFLAAISGMTENDKGHKELGPAAAAHHLAYAALWFAVGALFQMVPDMPPHVNRVASLTWGLAYAFVSTQTIMAHMCKEPIKVPSWPLIVMLVAGLMGHQKWAALDATMGGALTVMAVGYLTYVCACIGQICRVLDIKCLTIPDRSAVKAE